MSSYYIGLDPGKFTGVSLLRVPHDNTQPFELATGEIYHTSIRQFLRGLIDVPWKVAYERFTTSLRTVRATRQPATNEVTQSILHWVSDHDYVCHTFSPSDSKHAANNATLRELALYTSSMDGHANDATRQIVMHLLRSRPEAVLSLRERTKMITRVQLETFAKGE